MGGGGLGPSEQAILADTFPQPNGAWRSPCMVWPSFLGRQSGRLWWLDYRSLQLALDFLRQCAVGVMSVFLTSFMVQDPPTCAKPSGMRPGIRWILWAGVGGTGLGTLQVVLDKGQRDDWFTSSFIRWFAVISFCTLVAFVFWELNRKNPIVHCACSEIPALRLQAC